MTVSGSLLESVFIPAFFWEGNYLPFYVFISKCDAFFLSALHIHTINSLFAVNERVRSLHFPMQNRNQKQLRHTSGCLKQCELHNSFLYFLSTSWQISSVFPVTWSLCLGHVWVKGWLSLVCVWVCEGAEHEMYKNISASLHTLLYLERTRTDMTCVHVIPLLS